MSNDKDSFAMTFQQKNSFEKTAAFFMPDNPNNIKKSNFFRQRSPRGDFEIKQVFSGKPRSPSTKKKKNTQEKSPTSQNSFLYQSPPSRDEEKDYYLLQPQKRTSDVKRRAQLPDAKKQFSYITNRNKLPTVPKDIKFELRPISDFNATLSNSQSMLVLHDPSKDRVTRNKIKINLNQTTIKNEESSVQPSSDQCRYANKDKTILNKILNVKIKKKENNVVLNTTLKDNWAEFGICFDQKEVLKTVIKNPLVKKQVNEEDYYSKIKPQSSPPSRDSSPTTFQNNIKPARTFLQKKQQMAILNKLFSRNSSK